MSRLRGESAREITKAISAFASDAVCAAALSLDSKQPAPIAPRQLAKNATAHLARGRPNCNQRISIRYRSIRSQIPRWVRREGFVRSEDQKDYLPAENRSLNVRAQRTSVRSAVRSPAKLADEK